MPSVKAKRSPAVERRPITELLGNKLVHKYLVAVLSHNHSDIKESLKALVAYGSKAVKKQRLFLPRYTSNQLLVEPVEVRNPLSGELTEHGTPARIIRSLKDATRALESDLIELLVLDFVRPYLSLSLDDLNSKASAGEFRHVGMFVVNRFKSELTHRLTTEDKEPAIEFLDEPISDKEGSPTKGDLIPRPAAPHPSAELEDAVQKAAGELGEQAGNALLAVLECYQSGHLEKGTITHAIAEACHVSERQARTVRQKLTASITESPLGRELRKALRQMTDAA